MSKSSQSRRKMISTRRTLTRRYWTMIRSSRLSRKTSSSSKSRMNRLILRGIRVSRSSSSSRRARRTSPMHRRSMLRVSLIHKGQTFSTSWHRRYSRSSRRNSSSSKTKTRSKRLRTRPRRRQRILRCERKIRVKVKRRRRRKLQSSRILKEEKAWSTSSMKRLSRSKVNQPQSELKSRK